MLGNSLGGLDSKLDESPQCLPDVLSLEVLLGFPDILELTRELHRESTDRGELGRKTLGPLRGGQLSWVPFGGKRQRTSNITRVTATAAFATECS